MHPANPQPTPPQATLSFRPLAFTRCRNSTDIDGTGISRLQVILGSPATTQAPQGPATTTQGCEDACEFDGVNGFQVVRHTLELFFCLHSRCRDRAFYIIL